MSIPLEDAGDLEAAFVLEDEARVRAPMWAPEEDPLVGSGLPLEALRFETRGTLSMGAGHTLPGDSKAVLRARLAELGFASDVELKWAREVLGPRYDWAAQEARIVSRRFPNSTENMRACAELLVNVVAAARDLAAKHGDFEQRGPRVHLKHLRQRRRAKHNPKPRHKRNLPY
jgi:hypothetical protein